MHSCKKSETKFARNFNEDTNEGRLSGVRHAIVAANNHYAGFGPGNANIFRQLGRWIGLEEEMGRRYYHNSRSGKR